MRAYLSMGQCIGLNAAAVRTPLRVKTVYALLGGLSMSNAHAIARDAVAIARDAVAVPTPLC